MAERSQIIMLTCSFFSSRFISVIALSLSFTFCMQEQQILRPHCQHISTCPEWMGAVWCLSCRDAQG